MTRDETLLTSTIAMSPATASSRTAPPTARAAIRPTSSLPASSAAGAARTNAALRAR